MSSLERDEADARKRLLHSLSERIERYLSHGEAAVISGEDATAEARTLLDVVSNSPFDMHVQMTVAHLYWWRVEAARQIGDPPALPHDIHIAPPERRTAIAHFSAVYESAPQYVPAEAQEVLDRLQAMKGRASDLIDQGALQNGQAPLDEAIVLICDIVEILGEEDPTLPVPLSELAVALDWRSKLTVDGVADIGEAITAIDRAIALTHPDDPELPRRKHLRKLLLMTRYDKTGNMADLEEAIALGLELYEGATLDDADRSSMLIDFMSLYWRRYKRTQALGDLDAGIKYGRQGLALATSDDVAARASGQDDLAALLRYRGKRSGRMSDLKEAVQLSRQAVRDFPERNFDWITIYSGLGESLRFAGAAAKDAVLLREAIDVARDVVRIAAEGGHPGQAGFRQNVGVYSNELWKIEPDPALATTAVEELRAAAAGLAGQPAEAAARSDLGNALLLSYEATGDLRRLDEAIVEHGKAVGTDIDHPGTAQYRANLAVAYRQRYDTTASDDDRDQAIALFRSAAEMEAVSSPLRIIAARSWGMLEGAQGNWPAACRALGLAVDLLTRASSPGLARDDQERHLEGEPGLVSEAVAAAIEADDRERAAELFEQGRGVLTAHALNLRSDVSHLAEVDPGLAERFTRLRDALDGESSDRDARHLWVEQWHELLAMIRSRPGFADFLRPFSAAQLRAAAVDGPLVMVNVSSRRADALIIQPNTITLVPLPFDRDDATQAMASFVVSQEMLLGVTRLTDEQRERANERIRAALRWTWRSVTGPVLEQLSYAGRRHGKLPRMWWLPSALLNFLPLHAAMGPGPEDVTIAVHEVAICSYTPTVRSLVEARRGSGSRASRGPLVVAMSETPGYSDLPGVLDEATFIAEEQAGAVCLLNEQADRDTILYRLPDHHWVHFGCHGCSDRRDPSASHMLVGGGEPLSILDIAALRVDSELAFLSACNTIASSLALADESVHIAGAFHLAGYRHVIAAMWPVLDGVAAEVAQQVYMMLRPGDTTVNNTAAILHHAVGQVRSYYPDEPVVWASFAHIGP